MSETQKTALLIAVDLAAGLFIVGAAWWIFSVLQAQGYIAMTTPSPGITGATPADAAAQTGNAAVVSSGDLNAIYQDPASNNPKVVGL